MSKHKVYSDVVSALEGVLFDGMTIMSGGFGLSGNPERLIDGLLDAGVKDLTIISNNCGADGFGLWKLLNNGQIRKMISSYIGENKLFAELYLAGKLELELNPQGTLAERIRADTAGNLVFRKTARNFNPNMATAGKVTIAEVEEIVEAGALDPDNIHTPGVFVDRVIQGSHYDKRIEFRTTRPRPDAG